VLDGCVHARVLCNQKLGEDAGMRGVMACYRGCIKAVYAREVDAGLLLTRLECYSHRIRGKMSQQGLEKRSIIDAVLKAP